MERVTGHGAPVTAYVALGSNLDDPLAQVAAGVRALGDLAQTRVVRVSSLYRNPAVGYRDQPDFVNAVACIETRLAPRELLDGLLAIEHAHGRVRDFPNAPRTLDLDIVLATIISRVFVSNFRGISQRKMVVRRSAPPRTLFLDGSIAAAGGLIPGSERPARTIDDGTVIGSLRFRNAAGGPHTYRRRCRLPR